MKVRAEAVTYLIVGFFFLTLSNSRLLLNFGIGEEVAYIGLASILLGEFVAFRKLDAKSKRHDIKAAVAMFVFLTVGIWMQEMRLGKQITLTFSTMIITLLATCSENVIGEQKDLKKVSSSILLSILVSFVGAKLVGESCLTSALSGTSFSFGFNGGLEHKNYFGFAVLCAFIGDYLCYRSGRKDLLGLLRLICEIFLIAISNSNGTYLCLAFFILICNFDKIKFIKKSQRKVVLFMVVGCICVVGFVLYKNVALNITTYTYRYRGFVNWFKHYKGDWFHLFFGDAAMAFADYADGMDYGMTVRSVLGWDGSLEIAWLNVLLKSGFLGFIAYLLYFVFIIKKKEDVYENYWKIMISAIICTLLLSTLVESYLTNTKMVFGVYCYVMILGLIGNKKFRSVAIKNLR